VLGREGLGALAVRFSPVRAGQNLTANEMILTNGTGGACGLHVAPWLWPGGYEAPAGGGPGYEAPAGVAPLAAQYRRAKSRYRLAISLTVSSSGAPRL